jgi:hypothetical protein
VVPSPHVPSPQEARISGVLRVVLVVEISIVVIIIMIVSSLEDLVFLWALMVVTLVYFSDHSDFCYLSSDYCYHSDRPCHTTLHQ